MSLKAYIRKAKAFLKVDIWKINLENISKTKAIVLRDTKVVIDAFMDLDYKNLGLLSASLCYFCVMAIVPFLAVCFALTGGLGLTDKLTEVVYANFGADNHFVNMILDSANNMIRTAQSGLFGMISALMFVWLVIWMMNRVEKVFNLVWDVPKPQKERNQAMSYSVNIAILILSPFIIILFFTGSVVYSNILDLLIPARMDFSESIKTLLGWSVFGASVVMIISAMYKFIPTPKVKYKFAFKAALISGIAFTLLQYLYLETQLLVTRINAVYGTIAAIPLLLLWLRFGWLIVVMGAQVNYSIQKIEEGELPESIAEPKEIESI